MIGVIGLSIADMTFSCICFQFRSNIEQKLSRVHIFDAAEYSVQVSSKSMAFSAFFIIPEISFVEIFSRIRSSFPFSSSI